MSKLGINTFVILLLISPFAAAVSCVASPAQADTSKTCEQCGMVVDAVSQAHLKVTDSNGNSHYVECLKCAFKLLPKYGTLNITTYCDYYGPNTKITISLKDKVNMVIVNPAGAMFIDGNCMKNRVVYNQTAVNALFAQNGLSPYLATIQNVTVLSNAVVMTVVQAAAKYAFTATPSNLTSKSCAVCGMNVTVADQAKYRIVDGNGTTRYAECFMCALEMLKNYNQVTFVTYCDWYGPNYPIVVQSSQYGKVVTVTPSTAIFLSGGSCVTNRVAYNQTAANALLKNGYSANYTLPEQRYSLPSSTSTSLVRDTAISFSQDVSKPSQTPILILGLAAGTAIIVVALVTYKKIKHT